MARGALKGKWWTAILVTVVAVILGGMVFSESILELKIETDSGLVLSTPIYDVVLLKAGIGVMIVAIVKALWGIVQLVMSGAITLGYKQFHLNLARGEDAELGTLFVHKDKLWHGFCINFWQGLYMMLWTLCLIIPGIMASYSYGMAYYIANDHPEMTARQVITASKEMMQGHRWRLFCLDLSFIGWSLLAGLTLGIGSFAVTPYRECARAYFYQDLCGKAVEESV